MIHYQLRCGEAHEFDGWFANSAGFDQQAARGLLECPICGSPSVERALMTPSVPKKGRPVRKARKSAEPPASSPPAPPVSGGESQIAVSGERLPDQVRAMLQRMRGEVERNCDYVGGDFAEQARRLHSLAKAGGDGEPRGIYGETTPDEAEALADEGINIAKIPWVPRADG